MNVLVGLETLKAGYGWSDEELYDHFVFDLQVRYALGITGCTKGILSCAPCTTFGSV